MKSNEKQQKLRRRLYSVAFRVSYQNLGFVSTALVITIRVANKAPPCHLLPEKSESRGSGAPCQQNRGINAICNHKKQGNCIRDFCQRLLDTNFMFSLLENRQYLLYNTFQRFSALNRVSREMLFSVILRDVVSFLIFNRQEVRTKCQRVQKQ